MQTDLALFLQLPIVTHDVEIGSAEWLQHRVSLFNASDAPAMAGVSPYKKRSELVREIATGVVREPDDFREALFASGHRAEELARPVAEGVIGEDLYQMVLSRGRLGASLDGQTFDGKTGWEHKILNETIRQAIPDCGDAICESPVELPEVYAVQCEQQIIVGGLDRVLFSATRWNAREELIEQRHCWYYPNPERAQRILLGWAQLFQDAIAWQPTEAVEEPKKGTTRATLPALVVQVEGKVVESNFGPYRDAALAFIDSINTRLDTDDDFGQAMADAEFCRAIEKKLAALEENVISQAASVNELIDGMRQIREQSRQKALSLEKKIETRKRERKEEIAADAQQKLDRHILALNAGLPDPWVQPRRGQWGDAMKNKRSLATCQEAVDVMLADMKVRASEEAATLATNAKVVEEECEGNWLLFVDFERQGLKPTEDFRALALMRHSQAKDRDAKDKKLKEDAQAAAAPAPGAAVFASIAHATPRAARTMPPLSTKDVCALLGFEVSVGFLTQLGMHECARPDGKKTGTYWPGENFPLLCAKLAEHLQKIVSNYGK